jgi:polysaccharide deacetylase family protein (PEP-CTERM system associated)
MGNKIVNALTVDVEDYFHVSALASKISPDDWAERDRGRVVQSTHKLLKLFDERDYKATFFVLGWVADRYPELVLDIDKAGHEVASHGWSHQLVYNQTPEEFKSETDRGKKLLEDILAKEVLGYRAASYSITPRSRWALDTLAELGFKYDSSLFPVYHDRYGMPGIPLHPYLIETEKGNELVEFPLSTYGIFGYRLPVSGGGYFRLYPYILSRWFLNAINRSNKPFVFYLHPWEVDPEQPRVDVTGLSKFRHYNNLDRCFSRLEKLLTHFRFDSMKAVLQDMDLLQSEIAEVKEC